MGHAPEQPTQTAPELQVLQGNHGGFPADGSKVSLMIVVKRPPPTGASIDFTRDHFPDKPAHLLGGWCKPRNALAIALRGGDVADGKYVSMWRYAQKLVHE